jgi:hypothetical protein
MCSSATATISALRTASAPGTSSSRVAHAAEPGHFRWASRLGHTYQIRPEPIIEPLPDPLPRDREPWPLITPTDHGWEDDQILDDPQPGPDPPAPPHDPETDPPPF